MDPNTRSIEAQEEKYVPKAFRPIPILKIVLIGFCLAIAGIITMIVLIVVFEGKAQFLLQVFLRKNNCIVLFFPFSYRR